MKRLLLAILGFVVVNVTLYLVLADLPKLRFRFTNDTTKANLYAMPHGESFGLLVMGTSHARLLSNYGHHAMVEKALGLRMYNLGKDGGHGGILPEYLFLSRFYEEENRAEVLLYMIDPWVFYSPQWNENAFFLEWEPVDPLFIRDAIREGVSRETIVNHLQYKINPVWLKSIPETDDPRTDTVPSLNWVVEQCGREIGNSYVDGLHEGYFDRYKEIFERTVLLAEARGVRRVVFILPTTLCRSLPGKAKVVEFLTEIKLQHPNVELYDLNHIMNDSSLFYDYNHLNSYGMKKFVLDYLVPIVGTSTPSRS